MVELGIGGLLARRVDVKVLPRARNYLAWKKRSGSDPKSTSYH